MSTTDEMLTFVTILFHPFLLLFPVLTTCTKSASNCLIAYINLNKE